MCLIGCIGFHWQREVAKKKGLKWKHLIIVHYWSFHLILFFIFDRGGIERLLHLNSSDTLGGHFIKQLFLVLGLEPFCLLHHRVNKEVETFLRYFGLYYHNRITFISCTSTMWNSRSNTSKRCSSGSRSGCCGDRLRTVNRFVQAVHSWR